MESMSPNMISTLNDLFITAEGKTGVLFEVIDVHHMVLKGLCRRGLIELEASHRGAGKIQWQASLTKFGRDHIIKDQRDQNQDTVINDKQRDMKTVHLQLDRNKAEHRFALGLITELKENREFTGRIIQLLELDLALRSCDTSVLKELYPDCWIAMQPEQPTYNLSQLVDELKRHMQKEPVMVQQAVGLQPIVSAGPAQAAGGLKQLNVGNIERPAYEDDDDDLVLEVTQAKGDGSSAQNFLNSMMNLQGK